MAIVPIRLNAGINQERTQTLNEGAWSFSNLIRFFQGLPQKLGGWVQYTLSDFVGVPRSLHAWQSLALTKYLGLATATNVYVINGNTSVDVTPIVASTVGLNGFHGTAGSTSLTLTDGTGHNPSVGSYVAFPFPIVMQTTIPVILFGIYPIIATFGGGVYTIQLPLPLPSSTSIATTYTMPVISIVSGSQFATISGMPNNGYEVGSIFPLGGSQSLGLTTITANNYQVSAIFSSSSFQIKLNVVATDTGSIAFNGGLSLQNYYSAGAGGAIVPGIGRLNYWSLDNWGEFLVMCQYLGSIYVWQPQVGGIAQPITNSPNANIGIFVAMPEQILVAYGSSFSSTGWNPLLIRWTTVSDYTVWVASASNQAGSFQLPNGSGIVRGLQAPQQALFWTDIELWAMQYIGPPLVFGFNRIGQNCGLIAPFAVAIMASGIYWMSQNQFFVLDGSGVHSLPCPVWDQIFSNINQAFIPNITACPNSYFNEIRWDYPSHESSGENDSYVKLNLSTGEWDYGNDTPLIKVARTSWIDQSILGAPIGTDALAGVAQHEIGYNANMPVSNVGGVSRPLTPQLQTGYIMIAEGNNFMFVDQIYPDIHFGTATDTGDSDDIFSQGEQDDAEQVMTLMMTVRMVDYPGDEPRVYGPYPVDRNTQYIPLRARGRQMSLSFSSDDPNSFWRLGMIRYRGAMAGRR